MTVVSLGLLMGLLTVGTGVGSNTLTGFWEPIPHTGLPYQALMQREKLSPITTRYAMLC